MGTSSLRKQGYLTTEDVNSLVKSNETLHALFNKYKNSDGYVTLYEFERITNKIIEIKKLKKIMQIVSSRPNMINYADFKYTYALFFTQDPNAKLNFLCDFIFIKNNKVSKEDYIKKAEKYFARSFIKDVFLDENFLSQYSNSSKIERAKVYNYIKENYMNAIEKFSFLSPNSLASGQPGRSCMTSELLLLKSNVSGFDERCLCQKSRQSSKSVDKKAKSTSIYDKIALEFQMIEKKNGGIFPITLYEMYLHELYIEEALVTLIGDYLRKSTQKSFLTCEEFRDFSNKYIPDLNDDDLDDNEIDEKCFKSLFAIMAYPKKDYVSKGTLYVFFKLAKPKMKTKEIEDLFQKCGLKDQSVPFNVFKKIANSFSDEILRSFEIMEYIPYVFFKVKTHDKHIEKNCIEALIGRTIGNSTSLKEYLKEYIKTKIPREQDFYVIESKFLTKWEAYVKEEKTHRRESKNLKMSTKDILERDEKLRDGLRYGEDYSIITERIYSLFYNWYGTSNNYVEIKRSRIEVKSILNKDFSAVDKETNKIYEIEVFPVFLSFYNFDDLRMQSKSIKDIKESLKGYSKPDSNKIQYYPFSRKKKFSELLKPLEEAIKIPLKITETRLWIYFQGRFEKVNLDNTLEQEKLYGNAIIVLEIFSKNRWPSDNLEEKETNEVRQNNNVGLANIGNTCYLNSILQTFLNNKEIAEIFLKDNNSKINEDVLNFSVEKKHGGKLVKEFLAILLEKFNGKKKYIVPEHFKEVCGEYNETFKYSEEQDAHDFYEFFLNTLHDELNIKNKLSSSVKNKMKIEDSKESESQLIQEDDQHLGNMFWANTLREDLSYIHSLYLGQLRSTLTCSQCLKEKIIFEPFSSLSLPIPEKSKISIEVCLFRLPFTLKVYHQSVTKLIDVNLRISLKKIKNDFVGMYKDQSNDLIEAEDDSQETGRQKCELSTFYFDKAKASKKNIFEKENIFSDPLNSNIPIKFKMEFSKKDKCQKIIETLRRIDDLNLEMETKNSYTNFLITNESIYIDPNLSIEECFVNGQKANVYELLNQNGINKVFNYKDNESVTNLETSLIPYMISNPFNLVAESQRKLVKKPTGNILLPNSQSSNKNLGSVTATPPAAPLQSFSHPPPIPQSTTETIVPIIHRYRVNKEKMDYFFRKEFFDRIDAPSDFILLSEKKSIKIRNLYELIWDKYSYFLNTPSNFEGQQWWTKRNAMNIQEDMANSPQGQIKTCTPFVLKKIIKKTKACAVCPWFSFCNGCALNPCFDDYISFSMSEMLVVEWCNDVYVNDMNQKNRNIILLHPPSAEVTKTKEKETEKKISLVECLSLFTEEETLKDIKCDFCKQKCDFSKKYTIERLPKYLVLALKRFKLTKFYMQKIDALINFPKERFDLGKFMSNSDTQRYPLFDLYAVVNHVGTLTGGHYSAAINQEGKWILYDDDRFVGPSEKNLETNSAYLLIYKMKNEEIRHQYLNYSSLMTSAYKIFTEGTKAKFDNTFNYTVLNNAPKELSGTSCYVYGEPVNTSEGPGYLVDVYKTNNEIKAKVRLSKNIIEVNVTEDVISKFKESIKKDERDAENVPEKKAQKRICEKCSII